MNTSSFTAKIVTCAFVIGSSVVVRAQTFAPTLTERLGCILKARAYVDPTRLSDPRHNTPSRFDLQLYQPGNTPYRWDFVIPGSNFPRTEALESMGRSDYRTQKQATIYATMRQYDLLEEKVTFTNLDLAPAKPIYGSSITSRALSLPEARSITTPSGITVTLPAQSYDAIPGFMAGNPNALFIRIEITPNAKLITSLPDSPLFRRHHRPISLQLGALMLVYGQEEIRYYDDATPNYGRVALSIPNLKTAMHLDQLSFFVRQRTDLQTVPIAIQVPISKPAPPKARTKRR